MVGGGVSYLSKNEVYYQIEGLQRSMVHSD
jgi:hypothetical protein